MANGTGSDIEISNTQIRQPTCIQQGSGLWSSLISLGTRVVPKVLPVASFLTSKVLLGLSTGALSSRRSSGMDTILGRGVQTGGFLIRQNKFNQLKACIHLSAKQKQDTLNALQAGSGVAIKPTKIQSGGLKEHY